MRHRSLAVALPLDQRDEVPVSCTESSRHLGSAVKQLAPPNLQSPLIEGRAIAGNNVDTPSIQLKRTLGSKPGGVWNMSLGFSHVLGKMIYATALGCVLVALFKLLNWQVWRPVSGSRSSMDERRIAASSHTLTDSPTDLSHKRATIKQNGIMRKIHKVLSLLKMQAGDHPESVDLRTASVSSGLSSSITSTYRLPMPVEDAEALVKRWQAIKAEALGPNHDILGLVEILEGSMLVQVRFICSEALFNLRTLISLMIFGMLIHSSVLHLCFTYFIPCSAMFQSPVIAKLFNSISC